VYPTKLYKYCPFDMYALRAISEAEVYYASPKAFNDPLDCNPTIDLDIETREAFSLLKNMLLQNRVKIDEINKMLVHIHYMAKETLDDSTLTDSEVDTNIRWSLQREIQKLLEVQMARNGVLAVSEVYDSVLMWSHYADHHRGCALSTIPQSRRCRVSGRLIIALRDRSGRTISSAGSSTIMTKRNRESSKRTSFRNQASGATRKNGETSATRSEFARSPSFCRQYTLACALTLRSNRRSYALYLATGTSTSTTCGRQVTVFNSRATRQNGTTLNRLESDSLRLSSSVSFPYIPMNRMSRRKSKREALRLSLPDAGKPFP
jgi:hypothetical protein